MLSYQIYQEALYKQAINSKDDLLIKIATETRKNIWKDNFGTPTVEFLLEYEEEVNKLQKQFNFEQKFEKKSQKVIEPPNQDGFISTLNAMGFMRDQITDEYSKEFLNYSKNKKVLEIGAAYGVLSLECLKNGSTVYANDLDPKHLAVLNKKWKKQKNYNEKSLIMVPGSFPNEFDFPENSFDAISIIRVLHFFHPNEIHNAMNKLYKWLKPGGKLFVLNETPFLKNTQKLVPVYEERLKTKNEWPSFAEDISKYVEVYSSNLPKFLLFFTPDLLSRELKKSNFKIEKVSFVNQKEFPKNMVLDGRESCGGIGIKPVFKKSLPAPLKGIDSNFNQFTYISIVERVPKIIDSIIENNTDYEETVKIELMKLKISLMKGEKPPKRNTSRNEWNLYREVLENYDDYTWLTFPWFFMENMIYHEILEITNFSKNLIDPFEKQKSKSLEVVLENPKIFDILHKFLENDKDGDDSIIEFFEHSLWGNLEDLSFSGGNNEKLKSENLKSFDKIIVNNSYQLEHFIKNLKQNSEIHIVLDNCGCELLCDMILAHIFIKKKIATSIQFHAKKYPVFVSDVMIKDFHFTINQLKNHKNLKHFGEIFENHLNSNEWSLFEHEFYTSPLPLWEMPNDLRNEFKKADLVIFKGDANYRRILGDLHWDFNSNFDSIVEHFPTSILSLRTLKSGVIVGVENEMIEKMNSEDPKWCVNGTRGIIQFSTKK
eukprot:gene5512-9329_t